MRVLVISPMFPPLADSEGFCGGKFVQGLVEAGLDPLVIHCTNIMRHQRFDTSKRWNSLGAISMDVSNPRLSLGMRCWLGLLYQTITWTGWTDSVVSEARTSHRQSPFDLVISRALPWYAHLAGYWVASVLRIPWLANFNDPWDLSLLISNEPSRQGWKQDRAVKFWRQRVLSRADMITFPCERLRDYLLQGFPRQSGIYVIPHIGAARASAEETREFVLVHAGRLNEATVRRANALLEGLAEFVKSHPSAKSLTRMVFVGPEDSATIEHVAKLGLGETVMWVGQVNYERSLEFIAKASVCLLVEGDLEEGIFLPSKLCDYIVARKPVLALSPAVGTINDLAREGGILRVNPKDAKGVSEALRQLFDAFVGGNLLAYTPPESLAQRYETKTVIQQFLEVVS